MGNICECASFQKDSRSLAICLSRVNTRTSDCLRLCEQLDEEAVGILVDSGLEKRFPRECRQWKHEVTAVRNMSESSFKTEFGNARTKLEKEQPGSRRSILEAVLDEVLLLYP